MKRTDLRVQTRTRTGKGSARSLRRRGLIPGVVYGRQMSRAVTVNPRLVEAILKEVGGSNALLNLTIEENGTEETTLAITKDLQTDPLRGDLLHVDFLAITADKPVTVTVPVSLVGDAAGIAEGEGILNFQLQEAEVECLPDRIPDELRADISSLGIGDVLFVKDLPLPEGVRILNDPDEPVASVSAAAVAVAAKVVEAEGGEAGGQEPGEGREKPPGA